MSRRQNSDSTRGTTGPSERLFSSAELFKLLWPLLVEQLLTVLVGVVDVAMVAYVGEAAVSGVALVDSVNYLFIQVIFALTSGGTVVCAQFIGANDMRSASKTGAQLMLVATSVMLVAALALSAGRQPLLAFAFGSADADVMSNATLYLGITAWSLPFMAVFYSSSAVFRAKGDTRLSMRSALLMNIINVIGNALCIFALRMGVEGVALATLLSRAIGAGVIVWLLQRPSNQLRIGEARQFRPDRVIVRKILRIGVPNGVESGLFNLGKVILQSLVATLGTASIAAYAVASSLVTFLYLPGNAIGACMLTVVGQCFGARELRQAKRYAHVLVGVNYVLLVVLCVAMVVGADVWVGFYSLSPETALLARQLVVAHSVAMIIWPPAFTYSYYFRGIGNSLFPMVVSITAMIVFRIGLAYLFVAVLGHGLIWVWYAMFVDWAVRAVVFLLAVTAPVFAWLRAER